VRETKDGSEGGKEERARGEEDERE